MVTEMRAIDPLKPFKGERRSTFEDVMGKVMTNAMYV